MSEEDPVSADIARRAAATGDQVAGEQVLGEKAAPEPDELAEKTDDPKRAAEESDADGQG